MSDDDDFNPATMDDDTIYIGTRKYVADRVEELERILASGPCEIAAHSNKLTEYMFHWEGRAYDAEARIEELEAEIARLRQLIPRPEQTEDELVWRDHMRGVPLAALAKEFGITKERMRHRLKRIAENKLHLTK